MINFSYGTVINSHAKQQKLYLISILFYYFFIVWPRRYAEGDRRIKAIGGKIEIAIWAYAKNLSDIRISINLFIINVC